jgi:DNA modification methylase
VLRRERRQIKASLNSSSSQTSPLLIEMRPVRTLKPNPRNARTHSKKQIRQIADNIAALGFTVPVLMDANSVLLAGHGRLEAAKLLGMKTVPAIRLSGLSEAQKRALLIADNKIAGNAGWDREHLALELPELAELLFDEGLDLSITGFEPAEIDQLVTDFEENTADPADTIGNDWLSFNPVSQPGDLWQLGPHRLLCGDARDAANLNRLLGGELAAMAFLDPPYNVKVRSVVGRGRTRHREFAMASGEMARQEFVAFLLKTLGNAAAHSRAGAVHFVSMDWRHVGELLDAGQQTYGEMLNLAVWVKSNAGQGSFYRSQHELVGVFRVGGAPHLNNIELGRHGRSRTNVWQYAGVNSFRAGRMDELSVHPTVKPVALVADAIKDCTRRRDIVLDTFCGSGTTVLAAERVGRRACCLELEPRYVDVALRRWQAFTGRDAVHIDTQSTFDQLELLATPERRREAAGFDINTINPSEKRDARQRKK